MSLSATIATQAAAEVSTPGKSARTALDGIYPQRGNLPPNAKDLGARGDDTSRPLSTLFATIADAQAVYPAATALTDELDWAVIQSCINANGGVYLPSGTYRINKTITATSPVIMGDRRIPKLYMTANNLPILSVTGSPKISDVRLTYNRQQTSSETESDAIRMFNVANGSVFERIRIDYPARGFFNYGGGYTYHPSSGTAPLVTTPSPPLTSEMAGVLPATSSTTCTPTTTPSVNRQRTSQQSRRSRLPAGTTAYSLS
ncbi:hypothetical protein [Arthrobacter sp. SAFR-044]|uniref:hypothetical protein n=1 Tax=Arthrobacter sp. SAFR-044 TaxID=3387278 RepID=UPI003F7C706C